MRGEEEQDTLDITFYHTRWGLKAGMAPFKHFLEEGSCGQAEGAQPPTQPPAIATSSHCLKTLKAFEKERDLLPWLSGEGAAPAQGG